MPNTSTLIVTLRKVVADETTAEQLLAALKHLLSSQPDITITAHTTTRYPDDQ